MLFGFLPSNKRWSLPSALAGVAMALVSCSDGGDGVGSDGGDGVGSDGGPAAQPDASETADAAGDADSRPGADSGCAPAVSPVVETDPDGPGYNCMQSGCHLSGAPVQGGLTITVSGTLYDVKSKPLPGATVYITDSAGKDLVLTTDNNANFWSGYSDGTVMPAGNYGTCLSYVKCYPQSQFEGACECATYAKGGGLQAASVSMCPNGAKTCTALGAGVNNGDCHSCHGTTAAPPAIHLP